MHDDFVSELSNDCLSLSRNKSNGKNNTIVATTKTNESVCYQTLWTSSMSLFHDDCGSDNDNAVSSSSH